MNDILAGQQRGSHRQAALLLSAGWYFVEPGVIWLELATIK